MPRGPPDRFGIDEGVCQALLDRLERTDGTPELFALARVGRRQFQRPIDYADLCRTQADQRPVVERPDDSRIGMFCEPPTDGVVQCDIGEWLAVRCGRWRQIDTAAVGFDEKQTIAVIGAGRHDDGRRQLRRGHQLLRAGESPHVAVCASRGAWCGRIGAPGSASAAVNKMRPSTTPAGSAAAAPNRRAGQPYRRQAPASNKPVPAQRCTRPR